MKKISVLDKNLCYWGALSSPFLGLALGRILRSDEKYSENATWLNKGGWTGVVVGLIIIALRIFEVL